MSEFLQGQERRIVLVGKTGNGKSATANTILGKHVFESKFSFNSVTQSCQKEEVQLNGRKVVVVDTPGFLDTGCPVRETATEVSRCMKFCSPGPHVILQVVRPTRFTQEEEDVACLIKEIFSLKAKNYMILLFTRKEDFEGKPLEDFINQGNLGLKRQVYNCGGRFLAFNNKAEGKEREAQVDELMTMIDELVKENKGAPCYTEDMMRADKENFKNNKNFSWLCPLCFAFHPEIGGLCSSTSREMAGSAGGDERRIVLVGKTGNGKSATGNTILGKQDFESKIAFGSVTKSCKRVETQLNGRKVVVVDTPGFLDTGRPERETANEVSKCVKFCSPGPHVILQVIRPTRFTKEEEDVARLIKEIFTLKAKDYMILLFTRKEDLKDTTLEKFIADGNSTLKDQVSRCGSRYLAFNNKAEGKEREAQRAQLMTMIDDLVQKNKGAPYYTEAMMKSDQETLKTKFAWFCSLF
ncbi:GTPase IMAP family member 8-like [Thamnophis elegans]|uniref:GTPase IMAP family member 8-like n=1 Tax=Thamnophis elegans TaxID=35005 RepID=UPI001378A65A|nr:GTPase IMAP family member 8-like [Thamnophis elegans]